MDWTNWSVGTWVMVWFIGFVLALIIVIYWVNYKDKDKDGARGRFNSSCNDTFNQCHRQLGNSGLIPMCL